MTHADLVLIVLAGLAVAAIGTTAALVSWTLNPGIPAEPADFKAWRDQTWRGGDS